MPHRVAALRPTVYLVLGCLLAGAATVWVSTNMHRPWATPLWGWVPPVASAATATAACWRVATSRPLAPAARRFWFLVGCAMALLGAAAMVTAVDWPGSAHPAGRPNQLAALVLYLGAVSILLGALLRLPGKTALSTSQRRRFLLDMAIVTTTSGMFIWYLSFRRVARWATWSGWAAAAMATVLVGFAAAVALGRVALSRGGPADQRALRILALTAAMGGFVGALAPMMQGRPHVNNAMLSIPYVSLITIFAADRQRRAAGAPAGPPRPHRAYSIVPYLAVAATDLLLLSTTYSREKEAFPVAVGAVIITGVVVYRQITVLRDNSQLLRRVDASMRDLRKAKHQLARQAHYDSLTGLANRRLFEKRVQAALRADSDFSVALIDLDDFKVINDRLGHGAGDALLTSVGQRLRACLGPAHTVARLGGDEFAILLTGVTTSDEAATHLDQVAGALGRPLTIGGQEVTVRSSIGLAGGVPGATPAEMMRRADLAMYAAKGRGKGRWARYDNALERTAHSEARLASDLRAALARDEFTLVFQPVVALPDGRPVGGEALVRWHHPRRGQVPPAEFIGVAERTGVIVPLGLWVLREACRQAAEWARQGGNGRPWWLSVNISARQLREPAFADDVEKVLRETGLPTERLIVEVTETAVFDNGPGKAALAALRELGVGVALDDFGTGHSSLGLLRGTFATMLKVDKSFVAHIAEAEESVIATAMLHLADGLALTAVAEGVETAAQAHRLHELGYRLAQGFHFFRPVAAADMGRLLTATRPHWPAR